MKEKMTNGTLMDSNLFLNFLQSLGASCSRPFFFPPLVLSRPVFEVSFLLFTMVLNLFWRKYLGQNSVGKESLPLSVPNSFLSLPVSTKTLWNQHHHALWEKEKPSAPLALLEAGGC